jgi:hypothetical protein
VGSSLIRENAEEFFARYDFETVIDLWERLGASTLMMMVNGMSPHLEPLPLPSFEKGPHSVLDFLEAATRALCAFAYPRDPDFKPEVLWQFSGSVDQWCADQTASHCIRAKTAFELARTELNRTLSKHRSGRERGSRDGCSVWEADGQIVETLKAVGHRLTTSPLLSKMSERYENVSVSTFKQRAAVMVREGRLTNDPKARPRGYGLPEWDGSPGS